MMIEILEKLYSKIMLQITNLRYFYRYYFICILCVMNKIEYVREGCLTNYQ